MVMLTLVLFLMIQHGAVLISVAWTFITLLWVVARAETPIRMASTHFTATSGQRVAW
jgi:hypothetical protein